MNFINRLYKKKISSKGLGVFRILFSLVLLCEIFRIYSYKELYYDFVPFINSSPLSAELPYYIWMFVIAMILFGFYTRIAAIINYLFILIYISSIGAFEYHMDYVYTGVGFLLIFIPASKSYSIDKLISKIKYSDLKNEYIPEEKTSVLSYWLIIFVGLILFYADSIYFKVNSEMWSSGLGMWLPSSLPQITILNDQWLLNQEYLIKSLGYLTFGFELLFPFLFWIKKMRIPLIIIGLGLHIGILFEFPIPYFALGAIAIYVLLVPNYVWDYLSAKFKSKQPSFFVFYDDECPLCLRTKIIFKHFDVFNKLEFKSIQKEANNYQEIQLIDTVSLLNTMHILNKNGRVFKGIYAYRILSLRLPLLFPFALLLYVPGISYLANKLYVLVANKRSVERCTADNCGFLPASQNIKTDRISLLQNLKISDINIFLIKAFIIVVIPLQINVHLKTLIKDSTVVDISRKIMNISSKLLGITAHGVFIEGHFRDYDKVYTLAFNDKMLPIYDSNGMPDKYLQGGTWVNFNFRVNNTHWRFNEGMVGYSAFWAGKNGVNLNDKTFKILMREVYVPKTWEKDILINNIARPWSEVGEVRWINKKAQVKLYNKDR